MCSEFYSFSVSTQADQTIPNFFTYRFETLPNFIALQRSTDHRKMDGRLKNEKKNTHTHIESIWFGMFLQVWSLNRQLKSKSNLISSLSFLHLLVWFGIRRATDRSEQCWCILSVDGFEHVARYLLLSISYWMWLGSHYQSLNWGLLFMVTIFCACIREW